MMAAADDIDSIGFKTAARAADNVDTARGWAPFQLRVGLDVAVQFEFLELLSWAGAKDACHDGLWNLQAQSKHCHRFPFEPTLPVVLKCVS